MAPQRPSHINIRVLLFRDGEWWIAQCLEYDIAAQARTLPEIEREFGRVLLAQAAIGTERGQPLFEGIPPAPAEFHERFKRAGKRGETKIPSPSTVADGGARFRVFAREVCVA